MRRTAYGITLVSLVTFPVASRAQDLPESSPKALMHHAMGVDAYVQEKNEDAIKHFVMAYESDNTSYLSLLMAGVAAGNAGQGARADSFYAMVLPHKDQLSAYYRYRLEAQMAGRRGDVAAVLENNRKAAALGPGTKAHYNVAQAGVPRGMATEGRNALRQLDPDKEPMKGWASYYSVYTSAAHQLGDYQDAIAVARRARAAFPGDIRPMDTEAENLAALGRVAEAEAVLAEIQRLGPRPGFSPADAYNLVGQEFNAHGNAAASRRAHENALKWLDALPRDTAATADNRFTRVQTLYNLRRYKEMTPILASLVADQPANTAYKGWTGLAAALNGDRATAMSISQKIESREIDVGATNSLLWRGLLASALGDRERAQALFRDAGMRPAFLHRDPVMIRVHGAALAEMTRAVR